MIKIWYVYRWSFLLTTLVISADVTEAGLNIENGKAASHNVNASRLTNDKSPSTYNFKMDH